MRFSRRRQPQRRSAVAAWTSVLLGLSLVLTSFVLAAQPTAATGGGQSGTRDVQIKKDWIGGNGTSVTITVTYIDEDGNQQQATRTCPPNDGNCGDEIDDVKVGTTVTISEPSLNGWWTDPDSLSCTVRSGGKEQDCTVENRKLRDVQIKKKWDTGSGANIGVPSGSVQLDVQSVLGSTTVTCTGNGTTWDCTPTVQAPADTTVTLSEPSPPAGWAPRSSDLSFTVPTSGSGTATHTVENKPVTRKLEVKKQWLTNPPPNQNVQLQVTVDDPGSGGPKQYDLTCNKSNQSTWNCGSISAVQVGSSVTIAEPNPPSGWQPDSATLSFTMPSGSGTYTHTVKNEPETTGGGGGDKPIEIKDDHKNTTAQCPSGQEVEWHFVINQIDSEENAPDSITAVFQNAGSVTIPLNDFTGGTAHYTYFTTGPDTLVTATATIYEDWDGQFNLSHWKCSGEPTQLKLRLVKEWEGQGELPEEAVTFTVTVDGEETTVTCGPEQDTSWVCTPDVDVEPGQGYSVEENSTAAGWTVTGGTGDDFEVPAECPESVCTHTVTNTAETQTQTRYLLRVNKAWDGPAGSSFALHLTAGASSVECGAGAEVEGCPSDTLEIEPGESYQVSETYLPQGYGPDPDTVGDFTFDPDAADDPVECEELLQLNTTDGGRVFLCTHTVVNRQLESETRYLLRVDKRWDGQAPQGAGPTLTLAVDEGSVSCTAGQDCPSGTITVAEGQSYSVSETNLPAGWAPDPATEGDDFTFDPEDEGLQCQESKPVLEGGMLVTTVTCTHTVVNRQQRYEVELVKQWTGAPAPSAEDAQGFELSAVSGEDSVTCTWDGTALDCDPDTLTVAWGETFTVTESGLPGGWANQSGLDKIDPADLDCTASEDGLVIRCTHTVVNVAQTEPGEEPERTLTLRKQWIGAGRPGSVVLEVTIGSETTEVTCTGSSSLWTCSPALDLPADDDTTVVIAEPDVPAGWETTSGTGTFTVGQLCGTAEDCTHTVVNRREQEREENPPSPPSPPSPPTQPSGPPSPPPVSEASPITGTPSPTPVNQPAPPASTPPTRVSEASPVVGSRPPQVMPKTGRGHGGSGILWLLTGLGSLLVAAGCGLEVHRRSRHGVGV